MKTLFALLICFWSMSSSADNSVWFQCGEIREGNLKEFRGYPWTLGYIHDLPKTAVGHTTQITFLDIGGLAWETGEAIAEGRDVYVFLKSPRFRDGFLETVFDRAELTFRGDKCEISDRETIIKKRDEMLEIQLGLNKI